MSKTEELVANEQLKARLQARRDGASLYAKLAGIESQHLETATGR